MKVIEIITGFCVVTICYILFFVIKSKCFIVGMNILLATVYLLFCLRKLSTAFYKYKDTTIYEKISILCGVFFLAMSALYPFVGKYDKIIGRIGFVPFLISTVLILSYGTLKKLFTDMPTSEFKRYIWTYVRCILIMISNIFLISTITYTSKSVYMNGILIKKIVRDGGDVYLTYFNDSLSMYETKVHIEDDYPRLDYKIYYDSYPDKINHIDTLNIDYY